MFIPVEFFLLPLFAFLAYLPSINGIFLFDDGDSVLNHPEVVAGKWLHLLRRGGPRKLTLSSYALQAIWPKTARSFHIVNILLHCLNGLIAIQIQRTLGLDEGTALLTGLLFVVGPFAVNGVAFITGRAAMLSAVFGSLGIWAILAGYPLLSLLCLVPSMLAKEDGVLFTYTYAIVAYLHGTPLWFGFLLLPFAGLIVLPKKDRLALWRRFDPKGSGHDAMVTGGLPGSLPRMSHLVTVLVETLLHYPLWALGLKNAPYHGSGFARPPFWKNALAVVLLAGALSLYSQVPATRLPLVLILVGPWLGYLFVPIPDQLFEHRNVASALGFALLFSTLNLPIGAWTAILIYMASITAWNANAWRDGISMWTACIRRGSGEQSRAWQELGAVYKGQEEHDRARGCFQKALSLNPMLAPAMRNLAAIAVLEMRFDDALAWLLRCTERCPLHPAAWEELGRVHSLMGKPEESETAHGKAVALDPNMDYSHNRLGLGAYRRNEFPEAVRAFETAMALAPGATEYRWNLACTLRAMGDNLKAREVLIPLPHNGAGDIQIQLNDSMIVPQGMKMVAQ